jgi:hypothetical protein
MVKRIFLSFTGAIESQWIAPFFVDEMKGLGTPEDLEAFLGE